MVFIFSLMKKRTKKIKAALASATCAPSTLKSPKLAPFGRSDSGDFFTLRFRSGRDADPSEAGRLEGWRAAGPDHVFREMV
jgi:hypothetical protein